MILKNKISYKLLKIFHPQMIYGYKSADGNFLKHTRISNTTDIECKEKLKIEDNVFIGHYNFIDASNDIMIEEGCQITNFISILTHSSHIAIRLYGKAYPKYKKLKGYIKGKVHLGRYTFVGPHSVIMPSTHIGKGSIVTAYSYVQGKFPDFSIIAGNPAKIVGDTRKMDKHYLEQHPELLEYYNKWVQCQ